jgi:hypothetical protein
LFRLVWSPNEESSTQRAAIENFSGNPRESSVMVIGNVRQQQKGSPDVPSRQQQRSSQRARMRWRVVVDKD